MEEEVWKCQAALFAAQRLAAEHTQGLADDEECSSSTEPLDNASNTGQRLSQNSQKPSDDELNNAVLDSEEEFDKARQELEPSEDQYNAVPVLPGDRAPTERLTPAPAVSPVTPLSFDPQLIVDVGSSSEIIEQQSMGSRTPASARSSYSEESRSSYTHLHSY
eukprot:COSAG03_NODE_12706_length_535_cov_0.809633_1_plen_162_part_01